MMQIHLQEYPYLKEPYAITVCRIEPENNVHLILEAFARQRKLPLVIVGNWKQNGYGLKLFKKYNACPHIHLFDPIYESAEINFLRSRASLYVHGHQAGGTNPSLVEAMYLALPILAFDCVYNRYTTENSCIYWANGDELFRYIAPLDTEKLAALRTTMKTIAGKRYRWQTITQKYEALP
ncbi:hypothetical protein FACS1894141_7320 [Spirochaetia bacterium]|nr:hypothetical protein FACS1894141_7320 [Spirochaetia bacterium]